MGSSKNKRRKMKIYKTYRFRMYPERFDQEKINSFLGTKRFIYNYYLNEKEKNNNLTLKEMKKSLVLLQKEKPSRRKYLKNYS